MRCFLILVSRLLLVPVMLTACGSSSYGDDARSAVSTMAGAISTYNKDQATTVASTGSACSDGLNGLKGAQDTLQKGTPPAQYAKVAGALRKAYALAHAGFSDCARGAPELNYPLMYQADRELARANKWILKARRLDH
jgi:hypothetical protein